MTEHDIIKIGMHFLYLGRDMIVTRFDCKFVHCDYADDDGVLREWVFATENFRTLAQEEA